MLEQIDSVVVKVDDLERMSSIGTYCIHGISSKASLAKFVLWIRIVSDHPLQEQNFQRQFRRSFLALTQKRNDDFMLLQILLQFTLRN